MCCVLTDHQITHQLETCLSERVCPEYPLLPRPSRFVLRGSTICFRVQRSRSLNFFITLSGYFCSYKQVPTLDGPPYGLGHILEVLCYMLEFSSAGVQVVSGLTVLVLSLV